MIRALSSFLALMVAARSSAQTTQVSDFVSPCPNVFSYDPLATESNKWYGVVNLTTDIPLYALWLNIVLENKANILGNWLGEVTTNDNINFKIENTNLTITPEQPLAVSFFVEYNANTTPPKLKAIRFNGKEICQVEPQVVESAVPVGAAGSYEEVRPGVNTLTTARPTVTTSRNYNQQQTTLKAQYWDRTEKPQTTTNSGYWRQQDTVEVPLKISEQNTAQGYEEGYQPWVESARNGMVIQSGVDPSKYPTNDGSIKNLNGSSLSFDKSQITTAPLAPAPNKFKTYDSSKPEELYDGGLPIFLIPNTEPQNTTEPTCGKVLLNKQTAESLKSSTTLEGQWPWQIALYQQQISIELHYKYICGGTLVSRRHIITAAHCVTRKSSASPVNKDSLAVNLGKHNLRTSVEGVEVRFVYNIRIYPDYDPTNLRTDLAILELRDTVTFSNRIQPVCLWPEQETDLQNVVGKKGYVFGWGYDLANLLREELGQLELEVVDQQTCLSSHPEFFSRFIADKMYCAGFSSTATCNGRDSGGGMVFQKGDSWYLRGVVSFLLARQGPHDCDPNRYAIFTDVAKFLPWIQKNIEDIKAAVIL